MTLDEILKEIKKANSFVILAHENPDGDAVGSCLGFATLLKDMGKDNIDVLFKEHPATFDMLPNSDLIRKEPTREMYDMAIVLDCPEIKRVSLCYHECFENAKVTVEFDHHLKNTMFADYNIVNPVAPATAQILVSSFEYLKLDMSKEVATALITGIITDTGGFRFESTTAETFEFASWALGKGVNISKLYKEAMMTKSKPQFEAEKLATDRLEFFHNEQITFTYMTKEDEAKLGTKPR
jgi:phosphoesterase RecJ-like protein